MTKQQILEKLYKKIGEEKDATRKLQMENICNILHMMPDDEVIRVVPEISSFIDEPYSKLDSGYLASITNKLKTWISQNPYTAEGFALETMNKRTKRILSIFLVIIGLLAIVAVPFALLNFFMGDSFCWGRGDDIASVLGTLDFSIGAMGFIWERKDDMKKKVLRNAAVIADKSGNAEKLIKCGTFVNKGNYFCGFALFNIQKQ